MAVYKYYLYYKSIQVIHNADHYKNDFLWVLIISNTGEDAGCFAGVLECYTRIPCSWWACDVWLVANFSAHFHPSSTVCVCTWLRVLASNLFFLLGACVPNQLRLYGGKSSVEGMLQICTGGGYWAAVCHHQYWDCNDMKVTCNQLGYLNASEL